MSARAAARHSTEDEELARALEESMRTAAEPPVPPDAHSPIGLNELFEHDYKHGAKADLWRAKLHALSQKYEAVRRVRGEGNCFYRSFWMSWVDRLLSGASQPFSGSRHPLLGDVHSAAWAGQVIVLSSGAAASLPEEQAVQVVALGAAFIERTRGLCAAFTSGGEPELLLAARRTPETLEALRWLRLMASAYVRAHADDFAPFTDGRPIEAFCAEHIERDEELADEPQLQALTQALRLGVRVEYLDSVSAAWSERCGPHRHVLRIPQADDTADAAPPPTLAACVLFRPGHYDMLRPRDWADPSLLEPDGETFVPPLPPEKPLTTDPCRVCYGSARQLACWLCARPICVSRTCGSAYEPATIAASPSAGHKYWLPESFGVGESTGAVCISCIRPCLRFGDAADAARRGPWNAGTHHLLRCVHGCERLGFREEMRCHQLSCQFAQREAQHVAAHSGRGVGGDDNRIGLPAASAQKVAEAGPSEAGRRDDTPAHGADAGGARGVGSRGSLAGRFDEDHEARALLNEAEPDERYGPPRLHAEQRRGADRYGGEEGQLREEDQRREEERREADRLEYAEVMRVAAAAEAAEAAAEAAERHAQVMAEAAEERARTQQLQEERWQAEREQAAQVRERALARDNEWRARTEPSVSYGLAAIRAAGETAAAAAQTVEDYSNNRYANGRSYANNRYAYSAPTHRDDCWYPPQKTSYEWMQETLEREGYRLAEIQAVLADGYDTLDIARRVLLRREEEERRRREADDIDRRVLLERAEEEEGRRRAVDNDEQARIAARSAQEEAVSSLEAMGYGREDVELAMQQAAGDVKLARHVLEASRGYASRGDDGPPSEDVAGGGLLSAVQSVGEAMGEAVGEAITTGVDAAGRAVSSVLGLEGAEIHSRPPASQPTLPPDVSDRESEALARRIHAEENDEYQQELVRRHQATDYVAPGNAGGWQTVPAHRPRTSGPIGAVHRNGAAGMRSGGGAGGNRPVQPARPQWR